MDVSGKKKEVIRLVLPDSLGLECLQGEWNVEQHQRKSKALTFWDTFEWGLWFGEHLLYSHGDLYCLCTRQDGWLGQVVCQEVAESRRRCWSDFTTAPMRTALEGMLGLRGLLIVAEGVFSQHLSELRNAAGKIVCRLEWYGVSAGKQGEEELLHSCQVMPLLGYEEEAARVVEVLGRNGAVPSAGEGPLELLLRHGKREPQRYTLRPSFGLKMETPAREALGRIVRTMLTLAIRTVPGILDDLDTEFLHDYRICLRKVRSALSLVKDVYPPEESRRMRTVLGDLARQTNRLRDLDVYLLAREDYLGLLPPQLRPPLEGMFQDFSAERALEVRRTTAKLRGKLHRHSLQEIQACFAEGTRHESSRAADLPVGPLVFSAIYRRYRKIRKIAAEITAESPDTAFHQLRIECKKLRYLIEFFSELIPAGEGEAMQKKLRRLQNQLGAFNDASVQQKTLLGYWRQKITGSDVALGLGGLVAILYHRQQRTRSRTQQALGDFCMGSTAATFKRVFKLTQAPPHRQAQS